MSDHEYAICPVCGEQEITIQTAPKRPPRMFCLNCKWNSLGGGQ